MFDEDHENHIDFLAYINQVADAKKVPDERNEIGWAELPICTRCPLNCTRTNVVLGAGVFPASGPRVMLVGEAPGRNEDEQGKPFIGAAGAILDDALAAAGLSRAECYITNAVKCRPPKNRKPNKKEQAACSHWLHAEIELHKPTVIATLGATSLLTLLGLKDLGAARRDETLSYSGVPVVACYHPAACLRNPRLRGPFYADVARLASIALGKPAQKPGVWEGPQGISLDDWDWTSRNPMVDDRLIAVDTETTMSGALIGVGVSDGSRQAWMESKYEGNLVSGYHPIVYHNAKFDLVHIEPYPARSRWEDTFMMAYLLRKPSLGLKGLAEAELGRRVIRLDDLTGTGKNRIPVEDVDREALARYCCQDARLTYDLYQKLRPELDPTPMAWVYTNIDKPLVPVLMDMERAGITVDIDHLTKLGQQIDVQLDELALTMDAVVGGDFNPGSNAQVIDLLFNKHGLTPVDTTPTGAPQVDAESLKVLAKQHPEVGEIHLILKYRELRKLKSTYVDTLIELARADPEHRVHTDYNHCRTETGRLSSSEPNLQNIPIRTQLGAEIRKAFVPRPGWVLIKADQSQVELRLAASLGRDESMAQAFLSGLDLHADTARLMSDVTGGVVTRAQGKTFNFGMLYQMGDEALAEDLGVSKSRAHELLEAYFAARPGLKRYLDQATLFLIEHGYAETVAGRRDYLPDVYSTRRGLVNAAIRTGCNMPIQGTAADIMRMSMYQAWYEARRSGLEAQLMLQVHDEMVWECPPHEAKTLDEILHQVAVDTVKPFADRITIPLDIEVKVKERWG